MWIVEELFEGVERVHGRGWEEGKFLEVQVVWGQYFDTYFSIIYRIFMPKEVFLG